MSDLTLRERHYLIKLAKLTARALFNSVEIPDSLKKSIYENPSTKDSGSNKKRKPLDRDRTIRSGSSRNNSHHDPVAMKVVK